MSPPRPRPRSLRAGQARWGWCSWCRCIDRKDVGQDVYVPCDGICHQLCQCGLVRQPLSSHPHPRPTCGSSLQACEPAGNCFSAMKRGWSLRRHPGSQPSRCWVSLAANRAARPQITLHDVRCWCCEDSTRPVSSGSNRLARNVIHASPGLMLISS